VFALSLFIFVNICAAVFSRNVSSFVAPFPIRDGLCAVLACYLTHFLFSGQSPYQKQLSYMSCSSMAPDGPAVQQGAFFFFSATSPSHMSISSLCLSAGDSFCVDVFLPPLIRPLLWSGHCGPKRIFVGWSSHLPRPAMFLFFWTGNLAFSSNSTFSQFSVQAWMGCAFLSSSTAWTMLHSASPLFFFLFFFFSQPGFAATQVYGSTSAPFLAHFRVLCIFFFPPSCWIYSAWYIG